jgi:hypothetical protein
MSIRMWTRKPIHPTSDGRMPIVSLVIASYLNEDERRHDSLMCLLYSLKAQTYPHWEAIVLHDGPVNERAALKLGTVFEHEPQIQFRTTPERRGKFGHPNRHDGIMRAQGHYVGLSNDDNYYCPVYFEWMVSQLQHKQAQLVFCSMVHSHRKWDTIDSKPQRGFIDAGNWLCDTKLAQDTPWTDMGFAGDWTYFSQLQKKAKGIAKIGSYLFVHN